MKFNDTHIDNETEKETDYTESSSPLPLAGLIDALAESAQTCQVKKDMESVVAACQSSRNVWISIHQAALNNPILVSDDLCVRAETGIKACLDAINAANADRDRVAKIAKNVDIRLELIRLFRLQGLAAADQQMKKIMRETNVLPV
jgi:hypothetical protein